jgi:hypothetical protein
VAVAREGLVALGIEVVLPLAEQALGDAEVGGGLGEAASLLGDELDGFDLELAGERASGFAQVGPPRDEFTLCSVRSPFVGKSKLSAVKLRHGVSLFEHELRRGDCTSEPDFVQGCGEAFARFWRRSLRSIAPTSKQLMGHDGRR